jgi:deoxyribonuclease-4
MKDYGSKMTDLSIGFCLDTCHLLTSGYEVSTAEGLDQTVSVADRLLGLENVPVIHANDSKAPRGSHIDRHENIGKGFIGEEGFRGILTHPKLRAKAFILETPVETDDEARSDIAMLKKLAST